MYVSRSRRISVNRHRSSLPNTKALTFLTELLITLLSSKLHLLFFTLSNSEVYIKSLLQCSACSSVSLHGNYKMTVLYGYITTPRRPDAYTVAVLFRRRTLPLRNSCLLPSSFTALILLQHMREHSLPESEGRRWIQEIF
jgi:hypothetical protein